METKKVEKKANNIHTNLLEIQKAKLSVVRRRTGKNKDGEYVYANLDDVLEVALPTLCEREILHLPGMDGDAVVTKLLHVPTDTSVVTKTVIGSPQGTQDLLARVSGIKKMHLMSLLNIQGEDETPPKTPIVPDNQTKPAQDITVELDQNEPFSEALQTALKYIESASNRDVLALTRTQVEKSTKLSQEEKQFALQKIDAKLNGTV